ncbi:MAG: type I restriction-modification system subunit M N-terminal domain-containing protein [Methylobacter sp.]
MITGELKNKIDKLWLEFWQGGIANPLTVIEQITFLMFARLLDINESRDEKREARTGRGRLPIVLKNQNSICVGANSAISNMPTA